MKQTNKKKVLTILLLVSIILAIIYAKIWTQNGIWKTYNDNLVELKYPSYLFLDRKINEPNYSAVSFSGEPGKQRAQDVSICFTHPGKYLRIDFSPKSEPYSSLDEYAKRDEKAVNKVEINGQQAFTYDDYSVVYMETSKSYATIFHCNLPDFNQVLSTIRFK